MTLNDSRLPSRSRRRWVLYSLLAVAGLIVLGVVLVAIPPINDPTEGTFTVHVVNDTAQPVRISFCHDGPCSERDKPTRVVTGGEFWQNIGKDVDAKLIVQREGSNDKGTCRVLRGALLHDRQRIRVTALPVCT